MTPEQTFWGPAPSLSGDDGVREDLRHVGVVFLTAVQGNEFTGKDTWGADVLAGPYGSGGGDECEGRNFGQHSGLLSTFRRCSEELVSVAVAFER